MSSHIARFKGSLTLLAALFVVMFVGAALSGGFYASASGRSDDTRVDAASVAAAHEKATAVARSGLELALVMIDPSVVAGLPEGADTVLFHAAVSALDGSAGAFVVRASRASASRVVLASTGQLATPPTGRCTARVEWPLDGVRPPPPAAASAPCVLDGPGGNP